MPKTKVVQNGIHKEKDGRYKSEKHRKMVIKVRGKKATARGEHPTKDLPKNEHLIHH